MGEVFGYTLTQLTAVRVVATTAPQQAGNLMHAMFDHMGQSITIAALEVLPSEARYREFRTKSELEIVSMALTFTACLQATFPRAFSHNLLRKVVQTTPNFHKVSQPVLCASHFVTQGIAFPVVY